MITNGIIYAFYGLIWIISAPLRLLDNVVMPDNFNTAMANAGGYLKSVNSFLPVDTLLNILAIFVSIEVSYFAYKLIMWIIKRFPTQS